MKCICQCVALLFLKHNFVLKGIQQVSKLHHNVILVYFL